jgi:3-oxoacid CoA-transferase subunit B
MPWTRDEMAARASQEIQPGMVVNLGIGIPTLVANHLTDDSGVMLHSENGLLGMGPFPFEGDEDAQVINAGKQTVTIVDGGSTFDSTLSFAMIRGGHVDLAVLGAMQVSTRGDIANWAIPGGLVTGMGGAMDLVSGAKSVIAVCTFRSKKGTAKLVNHCDLPLTGLGCVNRVVTDVGVFDPVGSKFQIVELAPGMTRESLGKDVPLLD